MEEKPAQFYSKVNKNMQDADINMGKKFECLWDQWDIYNSIADSCRKCI